MRLSSVSVLQLRVQTHSFSSSIIPYVDVVFTMSAAAKASETAQRTKEFPRHEANSAPEKQASVQLRFDKILSIISDNIGESLQDK